MAQLAFDTETEGRDNAITEVVGDITIDTNIAYDTDEWETGINRSNHWNIVEQYEDEERAKEGHEKWVNAIKENPDIKLPHLMLWE